MAYNHGKEERKWRLWKEAEEKILRAYGVDENIIEEIRIYDRAEFNSDRRFYRRLNDMEDVAMRSTTAIRRLIFRKTNLKTKKPIPQKRRRNRLLTQRSNKPCWI